MATVKIPQSVADEKEKGAMGTPQYPARQVQGGLAASAATVTSFFSQGPLWARGLKGAVVLLISILMIGDATALPFHLVFFYSHFALAAPGHYFAAKYCRSILSQKVSLPSARVEQFVANSVTTLIWTFLQVVFAPEPGKGGSYFTMCFALLVMMGSFGTILSAVSGDLLKRLQVWETGAYLCILIYISVCVIISNSVMGSMDLALWKHILLTIGALVLVAYRSTTARWPLSFLVVLCLTPFLLVSLGTVVVSGMIATNPSWAFVKHNTKYELLNSLGASKDFILHPREVCNESDAYAIPETEYPLIMKPSICTTSNKGVRPVQNASDIIDYLHSAPLQGPRVHRGGCYALAQRMVMSKKEFVIFYVRYPYMKHGFVKALGERGKRREVGSTGPSKYYGQAFFGEYFFSKLRNELVSEKLMNFLDETSHRFPGGWYSGRLDIKVMDEQQIPEVRDLGILEVNLNAIGDISEKPLYPFNEDEPSLKPLHTGALGWLRPVRQVRTILVQLYIGWYNLLSGNLPISLMVAKLPVLIGRAEHCQTEYIESLWGRE